MAFKKIIKDYLTFSTKERNAGIVLTLIIILFIVLPFFFGNHNKKAILDNKLQETIDQLEIKTSENDSSHSKQFNTNYNKSTLDENTTFSPFAFDPNTVNENGWHLLGLRDKTIHTLISYRNKGGQFREANDLYKIWGIRPEEIKRLIPYIHIANILPQYQKKEYSYKKYESIKPSEVDVNTATVEQLRIIPGMGNGLVFRLITYRERLGGFISLDQIKETFGMNDSSLKLMTPFLKLKSINIQKININTATDYDLSKHPYIERNIAKAIVLYRLQHGNYQSIEGIKKIVFIKENVFQKIAPYITIE